jgi:hypothetical protein
MFKELLLAIVLGALLGFGLTGGYVAFNKNKNTTPTVTISPTPTPATNSIKKTTTPSVNQTTDDQNTGDHQITIESPEPESIIANSQITLKGTTSPQSYLVITSPVKTYFSTADNAGNFSIDIEIESGVNLIQIDSIDTTDNQASAKLIVTYSTAKI